MSYLLYLARKSASDWCIHFLRITLFMWAIATCFIASRNGDPIPFIHEVQAMP